MSKQNVFAAALVVLAVWLITGDTVAANDDKPLTPAEAIPRVNQQIWVELRVVATKNRLDKRGEIYLDSAKDFHDPKNLGIVITRTGAAKFKEMKIDDPAGHFLNKTIRVRGTLILKEFRPRIEIADPNQIELVVPTNK